jgi:hypothetical protein
VNRYTESPSIIDASALLLDSLKETLRIIGSDRDAQLAGLLVLSQNLVERYTWRLLTERTVKGEFGNTTPSRINGHAMLDCLRAPVFDGSLLSITFNGVDSGEVLDGFIAPVGEFGECFVQSEPTQELAGDAAYHVSVLFKAGYPILDGEWQCPAALQQSVVSLAAYMFANPLDCGAGGCSCAGGSSNGVRLPQIVSMMLDSYVIRRYDHALYV